MIEEKEIKAIAMMRRKPPPSENIYFIDNKTNYCFAMIDYIKLSMIFTRVRVQLGCYITVVMIDYNKEL